MREYSIADSALRHALYMGYRGEQDNKGTVYMKHSIKGRENKQS